MICTSWNGFSEPFIAVCSGGNDRASWGVWQRFMCCAQDLFIHFWNFLIPKTACISAGNHIF